MLQIKTIYTHNPDVFDKAVNAALAEGWTLNRRTFDPQGFFLAEMVQKLGRWEWYTEIHGNPIDGMDEDFGYRCSECHVWADVYGVDGDIYEEPPTHILHYCPNCGVEMDGEEEV